MLTEKFAPDRRSGKEAGAFEVLPSELLREKGQKESEKDEGVMVALLATSEELVKTVEMQQEVGAIKN